MTSPGLAEELHVMYGRTSRPVMEGASDDDRTPPPSDLSDVRGFVVAYNTYLFNQLPINGKSL